MAFDIKEHVRRFLKSRLGAPVLKLCETESEAVDEAFEFAAVDYWIAFPYTKKYAHSLVTNDGELKLNIDSYKDLLIPASVKDECYFVGILREDMSSYDVDSSVGGLEQDFNVRLFGGPTGYALDEVPKRDPRYLADRIQYFQSTEDQIIGEVEVSVDHITNEVIVTYPPIQGQVHLWWGWGFHPDKTLPKVPMNHLSLFRRMVALQFLEIILASRSPVELSADFNVNSTDLQNKRDELKEELDREIPATSMYVALWG